MNPALFFFLGLFAACGAEAPRETAEPLRVRTVSTSIGPLADEVPVSAVLEAERWQPLYFQQGGVVVSIGVEEGAPVRAGQTLAALDTASQRNQLAQAELDLDAAIRDHARAKHDLDRVRAMAAAEAASPEALYDAEQRVIEAGSKEQRARLRLEADRIKLSQMVLTAPFDGILIEVNLRVGDRVQGDADDPDSASGRRPPMVVVDPSSYGLRASLPEGQASGLEVGLPAEIRGNVPGDPTLKGEVSWVAPSVDRSARTVAFRVKAERTETTPAWVRDGSSVTVSLLTRQRQDALTVPDRALLYHRGEAFVFVVEGGKARRTPVEQGALDGDRVEVASGLSPGERVAVDQLHLLTDGLPVVDAGEGTP